MLLSDGVFLVFLLVNLSDLLYSYTGFSILNQTGLFGDAYRLLADIANVAIIIGIIVMAIRRFILRPATLTTRQTTLLNPKARFGITRDSAIVAAFIFVHNAGRYLGESFYLALNGNTGQMAANYFISVQAVVRRVPEIILIGEHAMVWLSLGAVVAFLPYFPIPNIYTCFFAP